MKTKEEVFQKGDVLKCIKSPVGDSKHIGQIVIVQNVDSDGRITRIKEWEQYKWVYRNYWFELVKRDLPEIKRKESLAAERFVKKNINIDNIRKVIKDKTFPPSMLPK